MRSTAESARDRRRPSRHAKEYLHRISGVAPADVVGVLPLELSSDVGERAILGGRPAIDQKLNFTANCSTREAVEFGSSCVMRPNDVLLMSVSA